MQTNIEQNFIEEMSGLIAMLKNNLIKHDQINDNYLDIIISIKRLEQKADTLLAQTRKDEVINAEK